MKCSVVQAWVIEYVQRPSMMVYTQRIALDRFDDVDGVKLWSQVIVRFEDGSREYVPGGVAASVAERLRSEGHDVTEDWRKAFSG